MLNSVDRRAKGDLGISMFSVFWLRLYNQLASYLRVKKYSFGEVKKQPK